MQEELARFRADNQTLRRAFVNLLVGYVLTKAISRI